MAITIRVESDQRRLRFICALDGVTVEEHGWMEAQAGGNCSPKGDT